MLLAATGSIVRSFGDRWPEVLLGLVEECHGGLDTPARGRFRADFARSIGELEPDSAAARLRELEAARALASPRSGSVSRQDLLAGAWRLLARCVELGDATPSDLARLPRQ